MRERMSSVASLSTSIVPSGMALRMPQCPWSVYSSTHTSAITTSPGTASFMARIARGTGPFGSAPLSPRGSFCFGSPKSKTPPSPSCAACRACSAAWDTGSCETPGIVRMGRGSSRKSAKKSGKIRSLGRTTVSRTRARIEGVRRRRRGRITGKLMAAGR